MQISPRGERSYIHCTCVPWNFCFDNQNQLSVQDCAKRWPIQKISPQPVQTRPRKSSQSVRGRSWDYRSLSELLNEKKTAVHVTFDELFRYNRRKHFAADATTTQQRTILTFEFLACVTLRIVGLIRWEANVSAWIDEEYIWYLFDWENICKHYFRFSEHQTRITNPFQIWTGYRSCWSELQCRSRFLQDHKLVTNIDYHIHHDGSTWDVNVLHMSWMFLWKRISHDITSKSPFVGRFSVIFVNRIVDYCLCLFSVSCWHRLSEALGTLRKQTQLRLRSTCKVNQRIR